MKIRFENHWGHGHFIAFGIDRGGYLVSTKGAPYRRNTYIEVTILNFGIQLWRSAI